MNIIVLGGAGFIGVNLCEHLLHNHHSVTVLDNLSTGSVRNIDRLNQYDEFDFFERDICDGVQIDGFIDRIYHLASPASPKAYGQRPLATLRVGAEGTRHALELAVEKGARLLLTSTSEVYGDPAISPQPETYNGNVNPVSPRSVYDEAKRYAEALTAAYHREHHVSVRIARLFNTYGPQMQHDDGRVVSNFITQALQGDPLTIYGDGMQTRSLCYVDDMVLMLTALMESPDSEQAYLPMNLGADEEMTVCELAADIVQLTGSRSTIKHLELPIDDPKIRRPDLTRMHAVLGKQKRTPLREGLMSTIQYFKHGGDDAI